jgi:hypothetical protein
MFRPCSAKANTQEIFLNTPSYGFPQHKIIRSEELEPHVRSTILEECVIAEMKKNRTRNNLTLIGSQQQYPLITENDMIKNLLEEIEGLRGKSVVSPSHTVQPVKFTYRIHRVAYINRHTFSDCFPYVPSGTGPET